MLAAALVVVATSGTALADEDPQTGTATTCIDFNVLWLQDGIVLADTVPLPSRVEVDPGQTYSITSDVGVAYIDFYDANGAWIDWNGGDPAGRVPGDAAFGVVCVGAGAQGGPGWPDAPVPAATFTYHDAP